MVPEPSIISYIRGSVSFCLACSSHLNSISNVSNEHRSFEALVRPIQQPSLVRFHRFRLQWLVGPIDGKLGRHRYGKAEYSPRGRGKFPRQAAPPAAGGAPQGLPLGFATAQARLKAGPSAKSAPPALGLGAPTLLCCLGLSCPYCQQGGSPQRRPGLSQQAQGRQWRHHWGYRCGWH